jgi:ketosteroid isomerase-like protein
VSEKDVELIRMLQAPPDTDIVAMFTDDETWSQFVKLFEDHFEADFQAAGIGAPGGDLEARGLAGLREVFVEWLAPWRSYRSMTEDVIEVGGAVVAKVLDRGVPRAGDAEVELRAASVWTLRDGRVHRVEFHVDRDSAMRAASRVA